MQKSGISIYLAGSIKKAHDRSDETFWTHVEMDGIRNSLKACDVQFLNPAFCTDMLSDQHAVFGRDMLQVFCSDFVFVDARDRRGLGVGAEMMWAKFHRIPVVTWAPRESHYHKSRTTLLDVEVKDWVHPFVESLSDCIVETVEEGAQWMLRVRSDASIPIKNVEHIASAMLHYRATQLHQDTPMQALLDASAQLNERVHQFDVLLTRAPNR